MTMTKCHLCLASLLLASVVQAAPQGDEIHDLPGLKTPLAFKQYSGYLYATGLKRLHYWFVESSNNPRTDPVAVWLNGGPGCSSMLGILTENGPFLVQEDGVSLKLNPFSWNTVANVLYIESPAGVGYSYSLDKDYTTNDDLTAEQNFAALKDFFYKFPEYLSNELYITGESYAGIYVPMLTNLVLDDARFNLKGFAVGNGVSSNEMLTDSLMYFAYYHGLIGTLEWRKMLQVCCGGDQNNCHFASAAQRWSACTTEVLKVQHVVEDGFFNTYNLYAPCPGGVATSARAQLDVFDWAFDFLKKPAQMDSTDRRRKASSSPCSNDTAIITYLNLPQVRHALHIPPFLPTWENCVHGFYTKIYNNTTPFYHRLLNAGIRGLLYNGDVDMACNFLGDEWFVDSLQRPLKEGRKMWYYEDQQGYKQVAGFVKTFDLITFATIRGSGHMVPTDRPRPALVLFANFLRNLPP